MAVPWETLETIDTPDGPLALLRRGEREFLLTVRGRVLMTSAAHRSEDDLARLACAHLEKTSQAHVLVSGLGMGFTLRAALDVLDTRSSGGVSLVCRCMRRCLRSSLFGVL